MILMAKNIVWEVSHYSILVSLFYSMSAFGLQTYISIKIVIVQIISKISSEIIIYLQFYNVYNNWCKMCYLVRIKSTKVLLDFLGYLIVSHCAPNYTFLKKLKL